MKRPTVPVGLWLRVGYKGRLTLVIAAHVIELFVHVFFDMLRCGNNLFADVVSLLLRGVFEVVVLGPRFRGGIVLKVACGIFCFPPGLFCRALNLLGSTGIG
jgi:hypothetical protein